ncbi:SH3 domain-containing protein [Streptomyces sp. LBUM 1478]|uniref:SH3 domain-containing protein n=1 Tax=Streptomyces scabiei TaxID=1930 RepID=UPI000766083E|nr:MULTISPECIES: SH3 domain-containing protein [Streptomyces]MBP5868543.1 SH3 domain-containing protein [Streptomyces sp. LBUM 1485]MBP5907099.1 SH3 domain-containing protein [Streptomyces sp. LBUM 1478]MBP5930063.1 SH3 domain-containing protein [Streptomyces sp. LBUM 1479]MBP5892350.1 SH3 domain-containing protein [Streptomyces sp. LBUM 1481]MBP5915533.1 SH3 domain-containing protein [Streptomyces sp. LBUM 1486]
MRGHSGAPVLRGLVAAGITGGVLTVTALGTASAAVDRPAVRSHAGHEGSVRGTVVARGDLNLREQPTTHSRVVGYLAPGSHARVDCVVRGQKVFGDRHWYWLADVRGWASAVYVDTHGRSVPACTDPCPRWKDCDPCQDGHGHGDGNGSVSFTWTFTASGTWERTED